MSGNIHQKGRARTPVELDKAIDLLPANTKLEFALSLQKDSIGMADKVVGINDMWVSARLAGRLMNPAYYHAVVKEASNANR